MKKTCKATAAAHRRVCRDIDRLRFKRDGLTSDQIDLWGDLIEERDMLQGQLNRMECCREVSDE